MKDDKILSMFIEGSEGRLWYQLLTQVTKIHGGVVCTQIVSKSCGYESCMSRVDLHCIVSVYNAEEKWLRNIQEIFKKYLRNIWWAGWIHIATSHHICLPQRRECRDDKILTMFIEGSMKGLWKGPTVRRIAMIVSRAEQTDDGYHQQKIERW